MNLNFFVKHRHRTKV